MITVEEGISPEKILCTAEAYPQANYYWKYNDEIVATDNLLFFDKGITRDEAGEYTCIAQNRHGSSQILTRFDVLCKYLWILPLTGGYDVLCRGIGSNLCCIHM